MRGGVIVSCPSCGSSTGYLRERRPNGCTSCSDCGFKAKSTDWDNPERRSAVPTCDPDGINLAEARLTQGPMPTGREVTCQICGMAKRPRGRSVPVVSENSYCGWDCQGYTQAPHPGSLWPGETADQFGYPCDDADGNVWDGDLCR